MTGEPLQGLFVKRGFRNRRAVAGEGDGLKDAHMIFILKGPQQVWPQLCLLTNILSVIEHGIWV